MNAIWENVQSNYKMFEKQRLEVMELSFHITRESKKIIHKILQGTLECGAEDAKKIKKHVDALLQLIAENPYLYQVGAASQGLEEYAELIFVESYRTKGFDPEEYIPKNFHHEAIIGGIADASGELVRIARISMDIDEAERVYAYISALYQHFLDLEISRHNKLRTKSEDIRRNLLRLEEIIFNLKLNKNTGT